jgi:hypothetical protein
MKNNECGWCGKLSNLPSTFNFCSKECENNYYWEEKEDVSALTKVEFKHYIADLRNDEKRDNKFIK